MMAEYNADLYPEPLTEFFQMDVSCNSCKLQYKKKKKKKVTTLEGAKFLLTPLYMHKTLSKRIVSLTPKLFADPGLLPLFFLSLCMY